MQVPKKSIVPFDGIDPHHSPETRLWRAVIAQAIRDGDRAWFSSRDFEIVCEHADLEAWQVLRVALPCLDGQRALPRLARTQAASSKRKAPGGGAELAKERKEPARVAHARKPEIGESGTGRVR